MRDRGRWVRVTRGYLSALLLVPMALGVAAAAPPDAPLADAAQRADWAALEALLQEGADADARQGDGSNALHWASYRDNHEIAALLIRAGTEVNASNDLGVTPLWAAGENGSSAMVKTLLEGGADPNSSFAVRGDAADDGGPHGQCGRGRPVAGRGRRRRRRHRGRGLRSADGPHVGGRAEAFRGRGGAPGAGGRRERALDHVHRDRQDHLDVCELRPAVRAPGRVLHHRGPERGFHAVAVRRPGGRPRLGAAAGGGGRRRERGDAGWRQRPGGRHAQRAWSRRRLPAGARCGPERGRGRLCAAARGDSAAGPAAGGDAPVGRRESQRPGIGLDPLHPRQRGLLLPALVRRGAGVLAGGAPPGSRDHAPPGPLRRRPTGHAQAGVLDHRPRAGREPDVGRGR